ncbi:hypothetical protein M2321_003441 [Rhodoblastus acidophilus]|nr:GNAT family N-acetyltransferase [Rhodoblastus acidophilus]MCW2275842.1 hypothetical protein [Rhodoblastus acidophilus]
MSPTRETESRSSQPKLHERPPIGANDAQNATLFHEHWWLDAVSGGQFSEVEVSEGNEIVGRLPYVVIRRFGFTQLMLPPFTHALGPCVVKNDGKYQTKLKNRVAIVKKLIEQLPKHDYFFQICDPSCQDGLAFADGLAFQEYGFQVRTQYTFHIDCRDTPDVLLQQMHPRARRNIRASQNHYSVVSINDPDVFTEFYNKCLLAKGLKSNLPLERFSKIHAACCARGCGEIFACLDESGSPIAMTFVVWDRRVMSYLLTVRYPEAGDKGSVNLLIWTAMQKAHELGLIFDLDGVSTTGTAEFLSHLGGELRTRMIVTSARPLFSTFQHFKRILGYGSSSSYS